jgi:hypothetical protein
MNRLASRLTLAGASLAAGAAVLHGPAPLTIAGGVLLALLLPGLALTDLAVRGRTVTAVERAVLGPGLSLALVVLGGLALFASGVQLTRTSWTALLVGTTLVALVGAAARQRFSPDEATAPVAAAATAGGATAGATAATAAGATAAATRAGGVAVLTAEASAEALAGGPAEGTPVGPGRFALRALPLLLAAAMLGGAVWLSLDSVQRSTSAPVTALSATETGTAGANNLRPVRVTVTGMVASSGPYRLSVTGSNNVDTEVRTLDVTAGSWQGTLLVPATDRVSIRLYRSGDAAPYRTTLLNRAG